MPQYNYVTEGGERFTAWQRMGEPPLAAHPETGEPCRRALPSRVNAIDYTDAGAKTVGQQADRNMRRMGAAAAAAAQEAHTPRRKRPAFLPGSGDAPDVSKIVKSPEATTHYIRTGEVKP